MLKMLPVPQLNKTQSREFAKVMTAETYVGQYQCELLVRILYGLQLIECFMPRKSYSNRFDISCVICQNEGLGNRFS